MTMEWAKSATLVNVRGKLVSEDGESMPVAVALMRVSRECDQLVTVAATLEAALRWAHPAPDHCPTRANRGECPACAALALAKELETGERTGAVL